MVFMCPPKEETENRTKALCKLKQVLNEIEESMSVPVNPICVPCCVPLCDVQQPPLCPDSATKGAKQFDPPNVMVCYKIPKKKKRHAEEENKKADKVKSKVKPSKSRELRASILYCGCHCEERNGLQDDCPRTGCQGSPECLTRPPTCGPSEFCNGKHLGKRSISDSHDSVSEGGGGGKSHNKEDSARYKCFPAVLRAPVPVCCDPCT